MGLVLIDINIVLNLVLAMIMFGLGLSLRKEDFQQLFIQPKSLAIGLFAQMVILPLVAAAIAIYAPIANELKVGILILSVCPGGITSNLISYLIKGNVALAVSLTVCNALLSLISIPIMVNFFLHYFMKESALANEFIQLPFWNTLFDIFIVTIIPAAFGMLVRSRTGDRTLFLGKWLNIILPCILLLVFAYKFFASPSQGGTAMDIADVQLLTPYVITLNIGSMLIGFLVGVPLKLSYRNRVTIAIEVGLHNTALALLIAGDKLGNPVMEKPILVYAAYSFFVTFAIAFLLVTFRNKVLKKSLDVE